MVLCVSFHGRKWKDLVDEWVRSNTPGEVQSSSNLIGLSLPSFSLI